MSLSNCKLSASIAVSDMDQARDFYEGKLGLSPVREQADDSRIYASGGGASLHVYPSPDNAGQARATLATWHVDHLEQLVDELDANGVALLHYDEPKLQTDEKGIAVTGGGKVAWFKDPDGNICAVEQEAPT